MQPVDLDDIRRRLAHLRVESERIRVVAAGITEVRYHSTIGSPTTALLVDPDTTPVATALIVHPATGDRTSLLEDATALAHHGVRCLLPELPRERSDTVALGVESRVRAIETLCAGLEWLRRSDPVPRAIGYIGKNLGGALAGAVCAIDTRVTATVAVAPLPDVGRFFTDATHPVAHARRERDGLPTLTGIRDATAPLELHGTIGSSRATRWLIQLGGSDDWAPADETAASLRLAAPDAEIATYDGADHDLESADATAHRIAWMRGQLRP